MILEDIVVGFCREHELLVIPVYVGEVTSDIAEFWLTPNKEYDEASDPLMYKSFYVKIRESTKMILIKFLLIFRILRLYYLLLTLMIVYLRQRCCYINSFITYVGTGVMGTGTRILPEYFISEVYPTIGKYDKSKVIGYII